MLPNSISFFNFLGEIKHDAYQKRKQREKSKQRKEKKWEFKSHYSKAVDIDSVDPTEKTHTKIILPAHTNFLGSANVFGGAKLYLYV